MVSVIIPCYNCEALATETLDSLAQQTLILMKDHD